MIAMHRQYVRPIFIEQLIDESKQASGIDEALLFSSESDLDAALRKVNFVSLSAMDVDLFVVVRCFLT